MVESDEREIKPSYETTKLINLRFDDELKEVKISAKLVRKERERLVALLKEFIDVFVWSYINIIAYKLPLKEG